MPEGAYARVPVWSSGQAWFDALMDVLATPPGASARAAAALSVDTFLMVARQEWVSADVATGRGVTTAHETVAARAGVSVASVRRARRLLEVLGFSVTLQMGRYLTREERQAATAAHGGQQLKAASVRALTIPRPAPTVDIEHLPSSQDGLLLSSVRKHSPRRARARTWAASRPARKNRNPKTPHEREPRPIQVQRMAAGLVARVPWLGRGVHIGQVCDLLTRAGVDPSAWTVGGLLTAVDASLRADRIAALGPDEQRDPRAYFAWLLARVLGQGPEPDQDRVRREQRERAEERARRQAEHEARSARAVPMPAELHAQLRAIAEQARRGTTTPR